MAKKRSDVSNLQLPPSISRTVQTEGQLKEINHYVAAKKKKRNIFLIIAIRVWKSPLWVDLPESWPLDTDTGKLREEPI